ncbi:unnamed protein product [Coregonus sp. 'balchen']|nr:unnamed protein product [Coregonus sp. 'balchen']
MSKLTSSPWLSVSEVRSLDEPVKELLDQLLVSSTPEQFYLLLLLLGDGLDTSKVRSSCHRASLLPVMMRLLKDSLLPVMMCLLKASLLPVMMRLLKASLLPVMMRLLKDSLLPVMMRLLKDSLLPVMMRLLKAFDTINIQPTSGSGAECTLNTHSLLFYSPSPESDAEVLLKCATITRGFTILSSFMVAQYVSKLQKVTLKPDIKSHLTEGVYRILDLLSRRFLNTILQMGLRGVQQALL